MLAKFYILSLQNIENILKIKYWRTKSLFDVFLKQICEKFDENLYGQLQAAYAHLGKTQAAMDQLHMHFTSAIQNTAVRVLRNFVGKTGSVVNASGKQYSELCKVRPFLSSF